MRATTILAVGFLIYIVASTKAEDAESVKKNKLEMAGRHTALQEVPMKSDGVETTAFKPDDLAKLHAGRVHSFATTEGFGISRIGTPRRLPFVARNDSSSTVAYVIRSQELIGIAFHTEPAAYAASFITQTMKQVEAAKAGTLKERKLDKFETEALAKLRGGRDLVADEQPEKLRVVGAIRAGSDCMGCHNCKERELLGAFSYTLAAATPEELMQARISDAIAQPPVQVGQQGQMQTLPRVPESIQLPATVNPPKPPQQSDTF